MARYIDHWITWSRSGKIWHDLLATARYFVTAYLAAVILMVAFQRCLMYFPDATLVTQPKDVHAEVITYTTADGLRLTSWYVPPKGDYPVFVMFHGNAGNISGRAFKQKYFADRGYGFLLAEYRGYAGNPGRPSEEGLYNDARAALTWLMQEKKIKLNRIIVYGESIGTGTACEMALEYRGIKALVLEAPFANAATLVGDIYPWLWPFRYLTLDRYDSLSKAKYFQAPVIVLQGSNDEVIPVKHGRTLFDAVASPIKKYLLLAGGGHQNLAGFGLLEQIEFFIKGLDRK